MPVKKSMKKRIRDRLIKAIRSMKKSKRPLNVNELIKFLVVRPDRKKRRPKTKTTKVKGGVTGFSEPAGLTGASQKEREIIYKALAEANQPHRKAIEDRSQEKEDRVAIRVPGMGARFFTDAELNELATIVRQREASLQREVAKREEKIKEIATTGRQREASLQREIDRKAMEAKEAHHEVAKRDEEIKQYSEKEFEQAFVAERDQFLDK